MGGYIDIDTERGGGGGSEGTFEIYSGESIFICQRYEKIPIMQRHVQKTKKTEGTIDKTMNKARPLQDNWTIQKAR